MAEKKIQVGKVQVIWHRSSTLLKVLVILLIVFSMTAIVALSWVRSSIHAQSEALRAEAAALEERNEELKDRMEDPDSVQTIQEVAREELGMVSEDTVLIKTE